MLELRKRRDDLLEANNRLVEERRAMRAERDEAQRQVIPGTLSNVRWCPMVRGPESWSINPWVFAYTFKRVEKLEGI